MLCVYHNRDNDGYMSAAIIKHWNPQVELVGWDYGQPLPDLEDKDFFLVDLSFPMDVMLKYCNRMVWIDHHKSAIEEWDKIRNGKYIPGARKTEYAACELTWKYLFPDEQMPEIVRLLGLYDSFRHKGTDEEKKVLEFQYGARMAISNPEEALSFLPADELAVNFILGKGKSIYTYLCAEAKSIYARRFDLVWHDLKFAVVNREKFNPTNFGINYHADGYDAFMCFWLKDGKWSFSIYNDNGVVDAYELSKIRNGGGNPGAAGFVVEADDELVLHIMECSKYSCHGTR